LASFGEILFLFLDSKGLQWISPKQKIRKFFEIFLNIFDQKSQKHVISFFKEHIKICGHLREKFNWPF
jgi:hypothetical protein